MEDVNVGVVTESCECTADGLMGQTIWVEMSVTHWGRREIEDICVPRTYLDVKRSAREAGIMVPCTLHHAY